MLTEIKIERFHNANKKLYMLILYKRIGVLLIEIKIVRSNYICLLYTKKKW